MSWLEPSSEIWKNKQDALVCILGVDFTNKLLLTNHDCIRVTVKHYTYYCTSRNPVLRTILFIVHSNLNFTWTRPIFQKMKKTLYVLLQQLVQVSD